MFFRQSPCVPEDSDVIVERNKMAQTKYALEKAYLGFDNVTDPDLIDCYIYELNAVMKRYKFLLDQAAEMDLLPEEKHTEAYRTLSGIS